MAKTALSMVGAALLAAGPGSALQARCAVAESPTVRVSVTPAISTLQILPDTPLNKLGSETEIAMHGARGEYEPASLVIRNSHVRDQTIHLEASDLRGSAGIIGKDRLDLKHVVVWYQASGAWKNWRRSPRNMDAFLTPELLVNDPEIVRVDRRSKHNYLRLSKPSGPDYQLISRRKLSKGNFYPAIEEQPVYDSKTRAPVRIPSRENRQVWITVHIPTAAAPGVYSGSIRVKNDEDAELATVPITLEVYDFELPAPSIEYSMYYRGKLAEHHPTVSHEWKSEAQLRADYRMMLEHGISNPNVYQRIYNKREVERDGPPVREVFEKLLRIRQDLGLVNRPLYYPGRPSGNKQTEAYFNTLRADLTFLLPLARKYGVTDVYLQGVDEAHGSGITQELPAWRAIKGAGGKIFVAGSGAHLDYDKGETDVLIYAYEPKREVAAEQRRRGNRTFVYGFPQAGPEDPLLWRRNYGITVWQAGYDGVMPFAFQSQFGEMWNDWDDKNYRTEALAYPTADRPISTLAFEGLREGVDDVRYLTALEHSISRLRGSTDTTEEQQSELRDAESFVARLKTQPSFDPSNIRKQTVNHLRALNR